MLSFLDLLNKLDSMNESYKIISLEVFIVLLIPHLIWLTNNDYVTITYGIARTGLENSSLLNHITYPLIFIGKQIGILIPFFIMSFFLIKRFKFKISLKDKKLLFLMFINLVPIGLMFLTSILTGSKIRTMWMTPFYLFFGILFIYLLKSEINIKKLNNFIYGFLFLFLLSPLLYAYISLSTDNKRTDYFGKEIADLVDRRWAENFSNEIMYVVGDEWYAGNLSFHLRDRPKWLLSIDGKVDKLDPLGGLIYVGNPEILNNLCPGEFGKIAKQGICMIGLRK